MLYVVWGHTMLHLLLALRLRSPPCLSSTGRKALTPIRPVEVLGAFDLAAGPQVYAYVVNRSGCMLKTTCIVFNVAVLKTA